MTQKLILVGVGLFSEVALTYFTEAGDYDVIAFAEEEKYLVSRDEKVFNGRPVIPFEKASQTHSPSEYKMFVAVGSTQMNHIRARLYSDAIEQGYELVSYVHPGVRIWSNNTIGSNCFIFENNTIQPHTKIGNNVILWSGNHIGHHSVIRDHVFITSHVVVSGSCEIGEYCFIGVNATLIDGIKIGANCLVGAGALVKKDCLEEELLSPTRTKPREEGTRPRFFDYS